MSEKIIPPQIHLEGIGGKLGLGVFSNRNFVAGEILERSPIVILSEKYENLPKELKHRVFNWGRLSKRWPTSTVAIALGYGSCYNHSDSPSLIYEANVDLMTLDFKCIKNIEKGEQLTVHYNQNVDGSIPEKTTWFQGKSIEQVEI